MRGRGNTREARERQRRAQGQVRKMMGAKAHLSSPKRRDAYKRVTLPTLNLPPEREP